MLTARARDSSAERVNLDRAEFAGRKHTLPRAPRQTLPAFGYVLVVTFVAVTIFFLVWWLEESGTASEALFIVIAAGLATVVALLMRALAARREVKSESRQQMKHRLARQEAKEHLRWPTSASAATVALRSFEKRMAKAESLGASPEMHLEAHQRCRDYLTSMDQALRAASLPVEVRAALRAGQKRIRARQRHHILSWARSEAQRLTREAQQQPRASGKVRMAERALAAIIYALDFEPHDTELRASAAAISEFIVYVKIGRRVEHAERAAFRGRYERAIDYYHDALFDLSKAEIDEAARDEAGRRIRREIEMIRAFVTTDQSTQGFRPPKHTPSVSDE